MTDDECQPVTVSRRICASAHDIFQVLAAPVRHPEFDGSESLRGAGSTAVVSGVGDVFVMKMYYPHLGDCSQAPEEERAGMDNGKVWIEGMTKTLERLDALRARPAGR